MRQRFRRERERERSDAMTMWCGTLRGDDIQQAIAELKSQRATIRVRYEREMKQLETKIADLETLEHVVVSFSANRRGPRADVGKLCRRDRERAEQLDELGDPCRAAKPYFTQLEC